MSLGLCGAPAYRLKSEKPPVTGEARPQRKIGHIGAPRSLRESQIPAFRLQSFHLW